MTPDQNAVSVGIVAAMPSEARARGLSGPFNEVIETDGNTLLYICGVGPGNARRAAREQLAARVGGIVSWGVAGALTDDLTPGTVVLASSVVCTDAAYETDSDWVSRLSVRLDAMLPICRRPVYSGGMLVSGVADKKQLADETGAVAVDMESGAIAEIAAFGGVPFICIRVIVDPASFAMPSTLGSTLDDEGFISIPLALRGIVSRPGEIIPMLRLALYFRRATRALSLIHRVAGPRLLGPSQS